MGEGRQAEGIAVDSWNLMRRSALRRMRFSFQWRTWAVRS